MFTKKLVVFTCLQLAIIFGLIWFIAGNDRLFRSTVPLEQRLVSTNETIRKKAQQELLGLNEDAKKSAVSKLIPILEQDDPFVKKWAAISLALVGPAAQEAIPLLLQDVSSREKDVAQAAKVALSEIGAPDVQQLPSLLRTLQDPRDSVRCEAAISIGRMGSAAEQAVPVLIGYMARPAPPPRCFEDALASLAGAMPGEALPPLTELLGSGHPDIRIRAARVYSQLTVKGEDTAGQLLQAFEREKDVEIRKELTQALSVPPSAAHIPSAIWVEAFKRSHNEAVRLAALNGVRLKKDPSLRNAVWVDGLVDSSLPIRQAIALWIRQSAPRGHQTLPYILRMMKDPDPSIRRLGLETLRRSGVHSRDVLRRLAKAQKDQDPGVRCRAAESLIESGSPDRVSISLLIGDLKKDEDTARCAQDVLGLAGLFERDVILSMAHLVQDDKDPDLRSRAARVLMYLGPRARNAIPALLHAQKDEVPGADLALKAVRAARLK